MPLLGPLDNRQLTMSIDKFIVDLSNFNVIMGEHGVIDNERWRTTDTVAHDLTWRRKMTIRCITSMLLYMRVTPARAKHQAWFK